MTRIIFTEIPYQVNKAKLVDEIYSYTVDKIVEKQGKKVVIDALLPHVEVRDESDREGMRICLDLKKNSDVNSTLAILFLKTKLQCNYSANFTAVYNGTRLLEHMSLKDINVFYINHQKEVLTRRTNFDLDKSRKRMHILEGLMKATLDIDKTISLIKSCKSKNEAREKLIDYLQIDEEQSNAILQLQLHKLTGMELDIIQNEFDEITTMVKYLESLLNDEHKLLEVLKSELIEIRDKYGDDRRTQIIYEDNMVIASKEDLIENNTVTICLSKEGYIKRNLKYSEAQEVKENDEVIQLHQTNNKSDLILITNQGRAFIRKTYEIAEKLPSVIGEYLPNILDLLPNEKVIYITTTNDWNENLICTFSNGNISKMSLLNRKPLQNRQVAIKNIYNTDNPLVSIIATKQDIDVLMVTQSGHGLIVNTKPIKAVKSVNGKGVGGIKLDIKNMEDDKVIGTLMNVNINDSITMKTEKGKELYIVLNDISPNKNESLYKYISKSRDSLGNFLYNTRGKKNDKVVGFEINK
jgi:DNA gyrase subunit A